MRVGCWKWRSGQQGPPQTLWFGHGSEGEDDFNFGFMLEGVDLSVFRDFYYILGFYHHTRALVPVSLAAPSSLWSHINLS